MCLQSSQCASRRLLLTSGARACPCCTQLPCHPSHLTPRLPQPPSPTALQQGGPGCSQPYAGGAGGGCALRRVLPLLPLPRTLSLATAAAWCACWALLESTRQPESPAVFWAHSSDTSYSSPSSRRRPWPPACTAPPSQPALLAASHAGNAALAQAMCGAVVDVAAMVVALPAQGAAAGAGAAAGSSLPPHPASAAGQQDQAAAAAAQQQLLPYPAALRHNDCHFVYQARLVLACNRCCALLRCPTPATGVPAHQHCLSGGPAHQHCLSGVPAHQAVFVCGQAWWLPVSPTGPRCHRPAGALQPALPVRSAPAAAGAPQPELCQPRHARAAGGPGLPGCHGECGCQHDFFWQSVQCGGLACTSPRRVCARSMHGSDAVLLGPDMI